MTTKKHTATLVILILAGLTGFANAQMSTALKAQVPFVFVANGETMPAGQCMIAVLDTGRTTLSISCGNQHVYSFSIADQSPNTGKETALVFHQYGNQYFLAGIKRAGKLGYELPASKLESELRAGNVAEKVLTLLARAE